MVQVIKYGPKRRVKCTHCESILEYEKEDIKPIQTYINEFTYEITCPVCSNPVYVEMIF